MCPRLQVTDAPAQGQDSDSIPPGLPTDHLSQGAYQLAKSHLPASILNHSIRVFLLAEWLARNDSSSSDWTDPYKRSLLFVACVLHDIGCVSHFDGPQRFEVEGADVAAEYLRQYTASKIPELDIHEVWTAIAIHTSPGIAERISPFACLVRKAVLLDFSTQLDEERRDIRASIEKSFSRLNIEKVLGDLVVYQALRQPQKAPPASWPGVLLRAKQEYPDWNGVNKAF